MEALLVKCNIEPPSGQTGGAMRTLAENLTQYAAYHRDRRNIATHFVGVPLIVFAIILALTPPTFVIGGVPVTAAAIVSVVACLYYLKLSFVFGATMAVILFVMCAMASELAHRLGTGPALAAAAVIFAMGAQRGLQHYIEERVGPTVARRDGRPIPIHDDETPVRS